MLQHKVILVFGTLVLILLISTTNPIHKEPQLATLDASALFQQYIEKANLLVETSEAYHAQQTTHKALKKALSEARLAYKKLAFLLEYYYPSFTEAHLNGAPLYHAEKYSTHSLVKPPEGLQVLDELIFDEITAPQRSEIAILSRTLVNKSLELESEFTNKAFLLEEVVEACRAELIRIFAMGLTGFDTPGSANAIPEAASAIQSMQSIVQAQASLNNPFFKNEVLPLFEQAVAYLETNTDFDQFDRLHFLKTFINPLYAKLGALQKQTGLQPMVLYPSGRNAASDNLFNADFLDPYFYTALKASEDSEALSNLGKTLFHDERLSKAQNMSCATCHRPELAFSDGLPKSESNIKGQTVMRNSPSLINAVYADRYFYDMRAFTLEQQAEHVIHDEAEFNTEYEAILQILNKDDAYTQQFEQVFGTPTMDRDHFAKALASYVLQLQSFNSPFDQYVRGERQELAAEIQQGFNLFMGKAACGTCHFPPTFSGLMPPYFSKNESEILGVLTSPYSLKKQIDSDEGRNKNGLHYEQVWIYEKSFKTPSIRNVAKTAPYFHNGAYPSLELVVEFYKHGGGAGLGLEVNNQTLSSDALDLSPEEKAALVAFMKSLTDVAY